MQRTEFGDIKGAYGFLNVLYFNKSNSLRGPIIKSHENDIKGVKRTHTE